MIKSSVREFLMIVAVCPILFFLGGDAIAATNNCTIVGTWFGVDGPYTYMNTVTPGSSATAGQVSIEWVLYDPTIENLFPAAVRWTNSKGVWEIGNKVEYKYTWVAYALDATGAIVFVARASGTKSMVDCDHVNIAAVVELWLPGKDINSDPPDICFPAAPTETRMPLVQAVCQQ